MKLQPVMWYLAITAWMVLLVAGLVARSGLMEIWALVCLLLAFVIDKEI